MRIIIEEHKYAVADVKDVLKGIDALENVEGYVSVNYVGYFYNTDKDVRDCVFILPKVLLEDVDGKELVFGKYAPEEIINLDAHNPLTQPEKDFIYEFAVWIYRTIVVFHNDKRNKISIVYHRKMAEGGKPNWRLKAVEKWLRFLKPTRRYTSLARSPRCSISCLASCSRRLTIHFIGDSWNASTKSFLNADSERPV